MVTITDTGRSYKITIELQISKEHYKDYTLQEVEELLTTELNREAAQSLCLAAIKERNYNA